MSQAFSHTSVLADEAMQYLAPRPGGLYCDGTLGGGGHALRILEASAPDGRLIGIDRDPEALAASRARLAEFGDRATFVHGTFGNLASVLSELGVGKLDGILIDIGVSSHQVDRAERGFSFNQDGPIDMRMDPTGGETALDLMRRLTQEELATVLFEYGEERYSRRISGLIKDALHNDELHSTSQLAELVSTAIPGRARRTMRIHPATRSFQALRIAVNRELDELTQFLADFPDLLNPGGRCVVIAFHSLEDRLVKRRFRDLAWSSRLPPQLATQAGERIHAVCTPLTRKPVKPGPAELERNPRARSSRLRACEKVGDADE